ncbi:MAG: PIN domain-containing protein [Arcobacteraceae bacterium]
MIFLDTCLLIDYSKNKVNIDLEKDYCINSIVSLEFKVGALNKRELKKINRILSKIKLVKIDQSILNLADILIEKYVLSHNMGIYDAIIAASCLVYDLPLWTYNKKDFRFINELELIYEKIK